MPIMVVGTVSPGSACVVGRPFSSPATCIPAAAAWSLSMITLLYVIPASEGPLLRGQRLMRQQGLIPSTDGGRLSRRRVVGGGYCSGWQTWLAHCRYPFRPQWERLGGRGRRRTPWFDPDKRHALPSPP